MSDQLQEVDIANGLADAQAAPKFRYTGSQMADANEGNPSDVMAQHGLTMTEAKEPDSGFHDPSIVNILYHRYDGRKIVVPSYMTPKLLAMRIRDETGIPREYVGTQAWWTTPQKGFKPGSLKCLLHADQNDLIKDEIISCGMSPGRCKKSNINSEFDLENHMRLKHKREWQAIREKRDKRLADSDREMQRTQADALIRLAEAMVANQTPQALPSNPPAETETKRGPGRPRKQEE